MKELLIKLNACNEAIGGENRYFVQKSSIYI